MRPLGATFDRVASTLPPTFVRVRSDGNPRHGLNQKWSVSWRAGAWLGAAWPAVIGAPLLTRFRTGAGPAGVTRYCLSSHETRRVRHPLNLRADSQIRWKQCGSLGANPARPAGGAVSAVHSPRRSARNHPATGAAPVNSWKRRSVLGVHRAWGQTLVAGPPVRRQPSEPPPF